MTKFKVPWLFEGVAKEGDGEVNIELPCNIIEATGIRIGSKVVVGIHEVKE